MCLSMLPVIMRSDTNKWKEKQKLVSILNKIHSSGLKDFWFCFRPLKSELGEPYIENTKKTISRRTFSCYYISSQPSQHPPSLAHTNDTQNALLIIMLNHIMLQMIWRKLIQKLAQHKIEEVGNLTGVTWHLLPLCNNFIQNDDSIKILINYTYICSSKGRLFYKGQKL